MNKQQIQLESIKAAHARIRGVIYPLRIAALLAGKIKPGSKTIVLLSGKNIDMQLHRKIINHENYEL